MSALQAVLKEEIKGLANMTKNLRAKEQKARKYSLYYNNPDVEEYIRDLQSHRMKDLRKSQRYIQLAYAFIRAVPYQEVERIIRPGNEVDVEYFKGILNDLNFDPDVVAFADLWFSREY